MDTVTSVDESDAIAQRLDAEAPIELPETHREQIDRLINDRVVASTTQYKRITEAQRRANAPLLKLLEEDSDAAVACRELFELRQG